MAEHYETPMLGNKKNAPRSWFQKFRSTWKLGASPKQKPNHRGPSVFAKFKIVAVLVSTTVLSSALLYGVGQPVLINDNLYDFIESNRSSIQGILSVLTNIFAFAHLFVLQSTINFSTRILLTQYTPTLNRLNCWKAMSTKNIDLSLPTKFLVPAIAFFVLGLLPGFIWTAALTPNLTTRNVTSTFQVPFYGPDPAGNSWNKTWTPTTAPSVYRHPYGTFSYTPAFDRGDSMINAAAGAVYETENQSGTPRSDKTSFKFESRSYGVGSSTGLVSLPGDDFTYLTAYNYTEIGYMVNVTCDFNSSSQWRITTLTEDSSPYVPNTYLCAGATPDHARDWHLKYSIGGDSNVVAINAHANHIESEKKGIVTMAAGHGNYSALNNTQCDVRFLPWLFLVDVNLTTNTIAVTPMSRTEDMDPTAQTNATFQSWNCDTPFDYASNDTSTNGCGNYTARGQSGLGNIATRALRQLVDLSIRDYPLHISNLGEMFLSNEQDELSSGGNTTFNLSFNLTNSESTALDQNYDHKSLTYSIQKALKSLLDDSLFAFASAQTVLHNSTKSTPVTLTVGGVRFGTAYYIYGLFAFNSLLVLLVLEELIRTRGWRRLPMFDYNDLKSVIIASSMGGSGIADRAKAAHVKHDSVWCADSSDSVISEIPVRLRFDGSQGDVELVAVADGDVDASVAGGEKSTSEDTLIPEQGLWKGTPYVKVNNVDIDFC